MNNKLKKEFARYVSNNIMAMAGLSCYILADTYFVAQTCGADGLAALNIGIPPFCLVAAAGNLIGVGGATRFSVAGGRCDRTTVRIFTNCLYMAALLSVLFFCVGLFFIHPLVMFLGAEGATVQPAETYTRVILFGAPFYMFSYSLNAFVRNDKAPRLAMMALFSGCMVNVLLDYVFMYKFGWGIFGAAAATVASPAVGIMILLTHVCRKHNHFAFVWQKPSFGEWAGYLKPGMSAFVTELSNSIVILLFNRLMLMLVGNIGITAYGIVANTALVIAAVFNGIAQGNQPLISKYFGRNDIANVKKLMHYAAVLAVAFSIVIYIVTYVFVTPITSIFNSENNAALQTLAETGIKLYFIGFFFAGINIVAAGYFAAKCDAKKSLIIGTMRAFAVSVPAAVVLALTIGVNGIWLSFPVTELTVFFVSLKFLRETQ